MAVDCDYSVASPPRLSVMPIGGQALSLRIRQS